MTTPTLWTPRRVDKRLDDRRSFRADVLRSLDYSPDPLLDQFNTQLRRIDDRLLMVRANQQVVPGVPMRPGHYHLLVDNGPEVPLTATVIEGDDGQFVTPTSRVFEKLAAGDLRERRNWERFAAIDRERKAAVDRERARDREERIDHRIELVNAYTRTSVSTTTAIPWRQNQAGHNHGGAG